MRNTTTQLQCNSLVFIYELLDTRNLFLISNPLPRVKNVLCGVIAFENVKENAQLSMGESFLFVFSSLKVEDEVFGNVKCCCNRGQLALHFAGTNLLQAGNETARLQVHSVIKKNGVVPFHSAALDV